MQEQTQTQIPDEELVTRYSRIRDHPTAMKAVMGAIVHKLANYSGLEIREYNQNPWSGDIHIEGYHLFQRNILDTPQLIRRSGWGGLLGLKITKTHEEKILVYGDADHSNLAVLVADGHVLHACEEVAKETGCLTVSLNFKKR